jgi:hypothetical protein
MFSATAAAGLLEEEGQETQSKETQETGKSGWLSGKSYSLGKENSRVR